MSMIRTAGIRTLVAATMAMAVALPATAQVTTGAISGIVTNAQGAVIPGATVVLISESRGTRDTPTITDGEGRWTFPNTMPGSYTVEVTMSGFKTLTHRAVTVSVGDRGSVGRLTLQGDTVADAAPLFTPEMGSVQAYSGERSFAVSAVQIENLPIDHSQVLSVVPLAPGVRPGGQAGAATRVDGGGQNNLTIDGVSSVDTGNNAPMLDLGVEPIADVKILTSTYQAEYGRSSGLQIAVVTKSGTNRFRGSVYDVETDSDWNSNSWVNRKNGDPKVSNAGRAAGFVFGGPVGAPGRDNRLFFFYGHEYRRATTGGAITRLRLPTSLERNGDFSQTLDSQGRLFPYIKDPTIAGACSAADQTACFRDGGVLGRIPQGRLYQVGLNILKRYPLPNIQQAVNTNFNWQSVDPSLDRESHQPVVRLDYHVSSAFRMSARYAGDHRTAVVVPGSIPSFDDTLQPDPSIRHWAFTANYAVTPTTFIEGTYGMSEDRLAGGSGIPAGASANRHTSGLGDLPLIYPNAGVVDKASFQYDVLSELRPAFFDGERVALPPRFDWGARAGAAPPNQQYPDWLNRSRTHDVAISLTKVAGRHTIKGGFYTTQSRKVQNVGGIPFEGVLDFGESPNNPLDTGFGLSNAALGVFRQYRQQSGLLEGRMVSINREFYLQDNWKYNGKLTLDFGVRGVHQRPLSDEGLQMSNFFPREWSVDSAPLLYVPGCSDGAITCSGDARNAMNPQTGEILTVPGVRNTQALIGTVIPGSGNQLNGIRRAGDGISKHGYTWPSLAWAPRIGAALDPTGRQVVILRGGFGLYYDRPDGNTVFDIPGNPPAGASTSLVNGRLQELGQGAPITGVPTLNIYEYDAKLPQSAQWNGGFQVALPGAGVADVAYVGQHATQRLGAFQGGAPVNLNAVDLGAAYLAQNQDPTLGLSTVPGARAVPSDLMRAFRGLGDINEQQGRFYETYHVVQASYNRRFTRGAQFGVHYAYTFSATGNTGLQRRLSHLSDGSIVERADQLGYEDLNRNLDHLKHVFNANFVLDLPDLAPEPGVRRLAAGILNGWQLSGVFTGGSTGKYDISYSYQNNGEDVNLTGSPDYRARIVYVDDPGSGCSGDQYVQFNPASVVGPQYGSVGVESGRNLLSSCPDHRINLSLARTFGLGGSRSLQLRVDLFNALDAVIINARQAKVQYVSPTDMTVLNSQTLADGSIDPTRLTPRTAGFGAATGAEAMRSIQLIGRFAF